MFINLQCPFSKKISVDSLQGTVHVWVFPITYYPIIIKVFGFIIESCARLLLGLHSFSFCFMFNRHFLNSQQESESVKQFWFLPQNVTFVSSDFTSLLFSSNTFFNCWSDPNTDRGSLCDARHWVLGTGMKRNNWLWWCTQVKFKQTCLLQSQDDLPCLVMGVYSWMLWIPFSLHYWFPALLYPLYIPSCSLSSSNLISLPPWMSLFIEMPSPSSHPPEHRLPLPLLLSHYSL